MATFRPKQIHVARSVLDFLISYIIALGSNPTNFRNSTSSCKQSKSESFDAQFKFPYPAEIALRNVSSASVFLNKTPYVHAALYNVFPSFGRSATAVCTCRTLSSGSPK